jgi:alpha-L-fucosidase
MKMKNTLFALALACVALLPCRSFATAPDETPEQHNIRMAWWREAKFGLFIHWGVYSVPAGDWEGKTNHGEWIMENAHIPVSRYEQFAKEFNPVKFNAKAWVKAAKDAGMKYIVITSKHHDGFCMWPTEQTDWSIKRTPFQRDPLAELAAECKKQGIRFCLYHSIMDWHHPDWGQRRDWNDLATNAPAPDMDRYTDYMKRELKELITDYHPGVLWFDGEWEKPWTYERGTNLFAYIRELDPNVIINNRVGKARAGMDGMDKGKNRVGDFGTPEQRIPANGFGPGVDWESCMTMNDHWGYNKHDNDWKSTATLIYNLCDIASKGGNYLLNVGPTSEGLIPAPSVERLEEIGKWMKVNGESIYGTTATPFGAELGKEVKAKDGYGNDTTVSSANDWRATTKPGKIYLILFKWPADDKFLAPGLESKVKKAYLLADHKKLKITQDESGTTIALPAEAPDKIASVICLEIADKTAKVVAKK